MPRRKAVEEDAGPDKAWLDSYADAMTLLLAFFIMLFAFSLVDKKKFIEFKFGVAQALGKPNPTVDGGLGLLDRGNGIADTVSVPPVQNKNGDGGEAGKNDDAGLGELEGEVTQSDVEALLSAFSQRFDQAGLGDEVQLRKDPRGVVITMQDAVLFRSGSALVRTDAQSILHDVAEVLAVIDNGVVVEGHTDPVPTRGIRYPTNWELSTARATNVLRWFLEVGALPGVRFSAAGYADTRPIGPNETPQGRQLNRRVEIVVVIAPESPVPAPDPSTVLPDVDPGVDPNLDQPINAIAEDQVAAADGSEEGDPDTG